MLQKMMTKKNIENSQSPKDDENPTKFHPNQQSKKVKYLGVKPSSQESMEPLSVANSSLSSQSAMSAITYVGHKKKKPLPSSKHSLVD
jgi:hypothetical protein